MERAFSPHLALFLIFVVVAVFTGLLIYLGRLKRPTVLEVCRFLQPLDTQRILDLQRDLRSCWEPTLWHYRELKETLRELRRWFSMLQFDLRLLIAWINSQLMARAAVDLGELYDSTGGVSGVQSCFQEAFMNFRKPEPAATSLD